MIDIVLVMGPPMANWSIKEKCSSIYLHHAFCYLKYSFLRYQFIYEDSLGCKGQNPTQILFKTGAGLMVL